MWYGSIDTPIVFYISIDFCINIKFTEFPVLGQGQKRVINRQLFSCGGSGTREAIAILYCTVLCVCVCVCFPFILDIKFVGRTSRGHIGGRSHRISHPPSFCGACLDFSREKD